MKIHFEPNLRHQSEAIAATIRVFEGAPYIRPEERFWSGEVSSNVIKLKPQNWQDNVAAIAEENNIEDYAATEDRDLTIEMETGTGKTYVYIRSVFELNRKYGLHKFIIVVPSVAIREGVLATLRDTKDHFRKIYATEVSVTEYDSKKLPEVRSFCVSNHLSIMVMNKQAFDSDNKVINDENRDSGNLMEMLRQVQPVIIMDEPQEGMDTENMQARLSAFNPLFKLRYSATHREPKNVIHRLTPYDSYNSSLVKKIAVLSIHEKNTQSNVAIQFKKLNLSATDPTAKLQLNVHLKSGDIKSKAIIIKSGDDLEKKTGNSVYKGWIVEDIGTTDLYDGEGYIKFSNGEQITEGGSHGSDKETIFREQIRRAIQTHFRRKKQLVPMGIKPLVLFFIDRVANYTDQDGIIRRIFEEEYAEIYQKTNKASVPNVEEIHGGYFAKTGAGVYTDNLKSMAGNAEIYDKILRDKKTLLSFDEPLEFIFSHSALGVGWDNPNVFTICTLNESKSVIKKRQEIGRGLRLCVNQQGKRYRDPEDVIEGQEVNLLTVVANESYYAFAKTYQTELHDELGKHAKAPPMRNENLDAVEIRRNEDYFSSDDFKQLWDKIARKTRCRVHFREEKLIEKSIASLSDIIVAENKLETSLTYWNNISEEDGIEAQGKGSTSSAINALMAQIDVVDELARNTTISDATATAILDGMDKAQKQQLAKNPLQFLAEATKKVRRVVEKELVRLVKYEQTGDMHPLDMFEAVIETKRDTTPTPKKGLYDRIIHDSDVEKNIANDFDNEHAVRILIKLPAGYKISTPIGSYNPDFALVIEKPDLDADEGAETPRFYFTVETKGTSDKDKLKPDEQMKIDCAVKHFEAIGLTAYLAPVDSLKSFDQKALQHPDINQTFFDQ
ncbi:MAG: DEAD/DEAH box helicase family protein [Alphaproteobacteria bacterium]|nr:DEAD/DEAH box helicase family protein [Alphaproteobacteria bacterium]